MIIKLDFQYVDVYEIICLKPGGSHIHHICINDIASAMTTISRLAAPDWLLPHDPSGFVKKRSHSGCKHDHTNVLSGTKSVHLLGQKFWVIRTVILEVLVSWKNYCSSQRFRLVPKNHNHKGVPLILNIPFVWSPKKWFRPLLGNHSFWLAVFHSRGMGLYWWNLWYL